MKALEYFTNASCWYSGQNHKLVSCGRIVHIVGYGQQTFRKGNLYFVFSYTRTERHRRIINGDHLGHAAWVHPRHLRHLDGHCECGNLKLYGDYICIKCRSSS